MGAVFGFCPSGPGAQNKLRHMGLILKHRGHEETTFVNNRVALGERGSNVLPVDMGKVVAAFDGNWFKEEEKVKDREAKTEQKKTRDWLAYEWRRMGPQLFNEIKGPFAAALWDPEKQNLFLARDHLGIRPLYYAISRGRIFFASEIKALLPLMENGKEVDKNSLSHYLTFQYVPHPFTMFKGIYKLPPAHYLCFNEKSFMLYRYWMPAFRPQTRSIDTVQQEIRERVEKSVQLHLTGKNINSAYLSGGVDSSFLAALLRREGRLRTFSIGYENRKYSELEEARRTSRYLGTEHYETVVGLNDFLEHLPGLLWHMDEPVADPAAVSLYFVSRLAASFDRVIYSGEGADELFGGYGIYRETFPLSAYRRLPHLLRKGISGISRLAPRRIPGKNFIYRAETPLKERYVGNAFIFGSKEKRILLRENLPVVDYQKITCSYYDEAKKLDSLSQMQYLDLMTWVPGNINLKVDKMNAANSMEVRVPYLFPDVWELAFTLPTEAKIYNRVTKYAFRKAMEDLLQGNDAMRPKKGFPVPLREWTRGGLHNIYKDVFNRSSFSHWFNTAYLKRLLEDHCRGNSDHSRKLWTVLVFWLWYEHFIEGKCPLRNKKAEEQD